MSDTTINTAHVLDDKQGYTTKGVFKRHDGQYVTITITDDEGSTDVQFAHVHPAPADMTRMYKGHDVVVHSTVVFTTQVNTLAIN